MKQESNFFHTAFRLLKFTHSLDRNLIPLYMITSLVEALYPFITIFINARLIDALFDGKWKAALIYAGIMLAANAACGALLHYLVYKRESVSMVINRKCNNAASIKAVSLDYATFSNKQTLDEYHSASNNMARKGGFGSYVLSFSKLMTGMIGFFTSLGLLLTLCLKVPDAMDTLPLIVSPASSLLIVGVLILLLLGFLYAKISGYVERETVKLFYDSNVIRGKFDFFLYDLFQNEHYAKEIRMYGMKDMLYREYRHLIIQFQTFFNRQAQLNFFSIESSSVLSGYRQNTLTFLSSRILWKRKVSLTPEVSPLKNEMTTNMKSNFTM